MSNLLVVPTNLDCDRHAKLRRRKGPVCDAFMIKLAPTSDISLPLWGHGDQKA